MTDKKTTLWRDLQAGETFQPGDRFINSYGTWHYIEKPSIYIGKPITVSAICQRRAEPEARKTK